MGKVLKIGLIVAAVAVNFIPGVGQAISVAIVNAGLSAGVAVGTGIAIAETALLMITMGGLSSVAGIFAPKPPAAAVGEAINRLTASLDPDTPAKIILGRTAFGTDLTYAETEASKKEIVTQIFACAGHTVYDFEETYFNDEQAFDGTGAAQGDWIDVAIRQSRNGLSSQTSFTFSNDTYPVSAVFNGVAVVGYQFNITKDKISTGIPSRITQVGEGALVYDPRQDTTNGGSGLHRPDDRTTWQYYDGVDYLGENPVLMGLWYLLGWTEAGKDKIGMFINPNNVDFDSFAAMANVCEEIVDSKRRYFGGGIEIADGNHARFLNTLETSFGLKILKTSGGIYKAWIPHNDLVSAATITEADIIGPVKYTPGKLEGLKNIGRGQFTDPNALYQLRQLPEVRETAYVTEDGRDRVYERDLPFITDADVGQRVLRYHVRRTRYQDIWQVPVRLNFLGYEIFDVVTLNCTETANVNVLVRIMRKDVSPDGVIVFTCIEEHASIYDDSTPPVAMPPITSAPGYDPGYQFTVANLVATAGSIAGTGSASQDVLIVTWDNPGAAVRRSEVEYRKSGTTNWIKGAAARVDDTAYIITGVLAAVLYEVRVRHISISGVPGPWVIDNDTTTDTNTLIVDYSDITGTKPPPGATVGATWGVNIGGSNLPENNATYNTGALADKNTVATVDIDDDAVSGAWRSTLATNLNLTTSWQTLRSISITVAAGSQRVVTIFASAVIGVSANDETSDAYARIYRTGGGTVYKWGGSAGIQVGYMKEVGGSATLYNISPCTPIFSEVLSAGTYVYYFQAKKNVGTAFASNREMVILEKKK